MLHKSTPFFTVVPFFLLLTLNGKNLAQTLTTAAVDAGSAKIANKIGDSKAGGALNPVTHKAAHGALAVAGAKLTGRDPVGAAIGAVVSETAAEAMDKPGATHEERQKIAQKARLIGDTVAFVADRDVASADSAGKTAVENNYGGHPDEEAVPPVDVLLENSDKSLTEQLLTYTQASIEEGVKETQLWNETSTVMAPYAATGAVTAVGLGVPLVAKAAATIGTIATVQHFGSIAVDSGTQGLVQEAKDHPIMTTLAVAPFVPVSKVLNVVKNTTKTEQATQAVQQEFRFVQKLQPAKNVETVVNAAPAAATTAKAVTTETKAVETEFKSFQEHIPSTTVGKTVVDTPTTAKTVTSQPSLPLDIEPSSKFRLIREIPTEGPASQFISKTLSQEVEWTAPTGTQQTYHVYQRNDIDWNRVRTGGEVKSRGLTNLEAAKQGYAPEMADGSSLNLHHLGQDSRGPLVEVPSASHKKYNKQLHQQFGYQKQNPEHPVDRATFDKERPKYWMDRAMEVENGQK